MDNKDGVCEYIYRPNDVRGCSYFYGMEATKKFLDNSNLISIIRAHEAQLDGYKMHKWKGEDEFPSVITVFSAPNYCGIYNNRGAVLMLEAGNIKIS